MSLNRWWSALLLAGALCVSSVRAADDPIAELKHRLQERYPTLKIVSVRPAPIAGLYEVFLGEKIVYADGRGDHVLSGTLYDTLTKQNLTAARLDDLYSIDFAKLPFDRAIKIVKGGGQRQVAIFADPDCPYCQELERELGSVSDVTVYVFLYPLAMLHPDAAQHAHQIWCSPDRGAAWTAWVLARKPPPAQACDADPIAELHQLGEDLYINSTPTIFLASGRRMRGAPKAAMLDIALGPPAAVNSAASNQIHGGEPITSAAGQAPQSAQ